MIAIVPSRPDWPQEFQALGVALRQTLAHRALRIDHIGSTAVPRLAAKDIIDIQVTVARLDEPLAHSLTAAGYRRIDRVTHDHIPPCGPHDDEQWKKWFFRPPAATRPMNLHLRIAGRANQLYPLLFRDYLRTHDAAAQAYARVKIALARHHADNIDTFCEIKDPVCDLIISAATPWATQTQWQPGPSDG